MKAVLSWLTYTIQAHNAMLKSCKKFRKGSPLPFRRSNYRCKTGILEYWKKNAQLSDEQNRQPKKWFLVFLYFIYFLKYEINNLLEMYSSVLSKFSRDAFKTTRTYFYLKRKERKTIDTPLQCRWFHKRKQNSMFAGKAVGKTRLL